MESRQSDACNRTIAPVFKRLGIIDQWGNGLKLIADEMKEYPNIELKWKEVGLSFQVQFTKKNFIPTEKQDGGLNSDIIQLIQGNNSITIKELSEKLSISMRKCERAVAELKELGILSRGGSKKTGYWVIKE